MADEENNQSSQRALSSVKLPPFWPNNPAAWFRSVEAQFIVKGVTLVADKYYLVLAALGENQVERIHNVLDKEPGEAGYQKIKDALLSTHTLTPFQMVDKIANMEPLAAASRRRCWLPWPSTGQKKTTTFSLTSSCRGYPER
jgi:hypothetical protein